MIKGYLDLVTRSRVEGWVYSPEFQMRGRRVYAFIDKVCVGSGLVDVFREDLAAVGMGDGYLGFGFDIYLERSAPLGRLVLSFEGSDFLLLGRQGCIRDIEEGGQVGFDPEEERGFWRFAAARGWVTPNQQHLFSALALFGVQEHLVAASPGDAGEMRAALQASELLSLHARQPVEIRRLPVTSVADVSDLPAHVRRIGRNPPVAVLWTPKRGRILVAEGAHRLTTPQDRALAASGMIEYTFGGASLLFINLDGLFGAILKPKQDAPLFAWSTNLNEDASP